MAECSTCGQDMNEVDGCDDDRTIVFESGEKKDPIPFGEGIRSMSYQERIEHLEQQIKNGGRGKLSPDAVRKELDEFKDLYDEEEYNNRRCHDCGVKIGEYHHPGCDLEECPKCGEQYFVCDCVTEEKENAEWW